MHWNLLTHALSFSCWIKPSLLIAFANISVSFSKGSASRHLPEQACRSFPAAGSDTTETADCS